MAITDTAIKILAIGDTILRTRNGGNPFEHVDHLFDRYDYVIINMETVIIARNKQYDIANKSVILSQYNDSLKWLEKYREKFIFTLSNNHIFDCGQEGYNDTVAFLKEHKFNYVPHDSPLLLTDPSREICISALFDGISNEYSDKILGFKEKHRKEYLNIVCMHWGAENILMPSLKQIDLAKNLFKSGIDIIIGHHSHTPQGRLVRGDKLCVFSLGNFNMSHVTGIPREMERVGFMVDITVDRDKSIRSHIIPVYVGDDYSSRPTDDQRHADLVHELDSLMSKICWGSRLAYFLSYQAHLSRNYIFDSIQYGWIPRIIKYGCKQFYEMIPWCFSRGFLVSLIFLPFNRLSRATTLMNKINNSL